LDEKYLFTFTVLLRFSLQGRSHQEFETFEDRKDS